MKDLDSRFCVSFCESQREVESQRAQSFVEDTEAQKKGVSDLTELPSRDHCSYVDLYLTARDWKKFLQEKARPEHT